MGVIRNNEIIVDVIMDQVGPAVIGIFPTFPEKTELIPRQFEFLRDVEGHVFFWLKNLDLPMRTRMPKRLYVFFRRDALHFFADCDEDERQVIIEKVIAKIKEEYPPFA